MITQIMNSFNYRLTEIITDESDTDLHGLRKKIINHE